LNEFADGAAADEIPSVMGGVIPLHGELSLMEICAPTVIHDGHRCDIVSDVRSAVHCSVGS